MFFKTCHFLRYQEHVPNSVGAKLVCIDDRFTVPSIIFKGKDCINKYITWVLDKQKWTQQITKQYFNKRLIMTSEDVEICNNSYLCWICKQELNMDKVRDHFHVTGKFRGAADNKCNIYTKYFYSSLKDGKCDRRNGHIFDEQYQHSQILGIHLILILSSFHNHYLKKDVLLLVDLFEKFIFTCLNYYDLDPCHYFSAPGLSWDAMLKMSKVELEKISDPDKYMFFEDGMRGEVSYINKRYSETSKK